MRRCLWYGLVLSVSFLSIPTVAAQENAKPTPVHAEAESPRGKVLIQGELIMDRTTEEAGQH